MDDDAVKNNVSDFEDFNFYIPKHDDIEPELPEDAGALPLPCLLDDLDLQRPPGFVGRVADWIDSQCRYPRRKLAVASAIVGVGNIAGLRHEDLRDGITANLIAFCVAASSSGKEAVMQAFTEMHITAGMQGAMHGAMKSEQEIMRNVIDQQASFYNIDEIGIFLTKVRNAQKNGSAAYLEGIFGAVMSIYSKADSRVILGGDTKRELQKLYSSQLARAQDNADSDAEERAKEKLDMVALGIQRPFMSIVGYTTPSTFDGVMDRETATQGLLGRAIVVNEHDINPHPRSNFKKTAMPMTMAMKLMSLQGETELNGGAIEWRGDRIGVPTSDKADKLLTDILNWLIEYADEMNEAMGEASVAMVRRSYEMIAKTSFVLAIPHGERTVDHVRWAFAFVRAEMDAKIKLVFANDNAKQKPEEALAARILGMLDPEKGTSASVLANRTLVNVEKINDLLTKLEDRGLAKNRPHGRIYRGKKVEKWFPAAS